MTSTVKHTPWTIELNKTADGDMMICVCNGVTVIWQAYENEGNLKLAKLIAAAPEMLEQLKWTLWVLEDAKLEDVNLDITRAVIAKATGEQS